MALEIERKFLVKEGFCPDTYEKERIEQAYLCVSAQCTVRVRTKGEQAFITVKGQSNEQGFARQEFEYPIPLEEAKEMMALSSLPSICKDRYYVPVGRHVFEVDIFYGEQSGLVLAELELESEEESFERPDWLGKEVTGDRHYYNAFMAQTSSHS